MLCFNAMDAISSMSSITPCGYVGADTTISNTSTKKKKESIILKPFKFK
jgi:lipoate-protein ligase B